MSDRSSFLLRRLHGQLGDVVYEMTRVHFVAQVAEQAWRPALNIYRCERCLSICVDLAGVEKSAFDLQIEPRRLWIRGRREAPEPDKSANKTVQILAMEIDYGVFAREIALPAEVETGRVTAEQKNGFLWIYLPLRTQA
jgi:HSP20 family protein